MLNNNDLDRLRAFLSGRLDPEESDSVRLWLAANSENPEVERVLHGHFDSLYSQCVVEDAPRRHKNWLMAAVVAAVLMLPLGIYIGTRVTGNETVTSWTDVLVPSGESREVTLPDGSTVRLKAKSRLTCPQAFPGKSREVFFEGEMAADIAHDPERPFVIRSGDVTVVVHGTSFNFKAYNDTRLVDLMLLRGKVEMVVDHGGQTRSISMSPGDRVHYDRKHGDVTMVKCTPEEMEAISQDGVICFPDIPLGDIASDLGRYFGRSVVVADSELAGKRFFGVFSNGEGLDDILSSLDPLGKSIKITRVGEGYVLTSLK